MAIANPALSDKVFAREMGEGTQAGWAAPGGTATAASPPTSPPPGTAPLAPLAGDSPPFVTSDTKLMTAGGTFTATLVLLVLLSAAGFVGWQNVHVASSTITSPTGAITTNYSISVAPWLWVAGLVAFGLAILTIFKPKLARLTGPLYAIGEGLILGAISSAYNLQFDGIVLQAVLGTMAVFTVMLFLYATRLVKVTERFRRIVIFSMLGYLLLLLTTGIANLFGANLTFWNDPTPFGIGLSVFIVIIASMNLMLQFDFVEKAIAARAPKYLEWYAAFGLVLALVWLYLEILRLLALLNRR